ncbi:MAG: NAD(P)/FAD-dependent oxidoreductase [Prevotellaceae bacterium]|jgi:dihydrolipoamide dehydrogenase|nr:NAD(P)/FAD-dependent oxidoreductase [Prevotellaceae bacterium]
MFDLSIIGGGPAGYTAAERAANKGLSVVLFEKNAMGGVCLNEGCIPTKTLLYSAKLYHNALAGEKYGISAQNVDFDYAKIVSRKNKIVRKLNAGIRAKMTAHNVNVVVGEAVIKNYSEEKIEILCNENIFEAKKLLLCCGSQTFVPKIKGVENVEFLTSREALEIKELPASIAIVGGGVIGMEFAGLFRTFGAKVAVVEMANEILPPFDSEISALLRENYQKQGVEFFLGAKVIEIQSLPCHCGLDTQSPENETIACQARNDNEGAQKIIFIDKENVEQTLEVEKILLCVGRKPTLNGLEMLNLETFRGGVKVDENMQTSLKNVYAAGDITGFSMLAHTAVREAEVAVNHIVGNVDKMHYNAVPAVVYTNPEVAGVGKTEDELKISGEKYSVKKLPMTFSGRFVAENEGGNGLCKLIFDEKERLIGAHLIGNPASELIATATLAIEQHLDIEQFKKLIFPHPSVGEIFKETLFE